MPAVLLLLIMVLLSGCTTMPLNIIHDSHATDRWLAQIAPRYQLSDWQVKGRLGVQMLDDGGQADLIWHQQKGAVFNIQLNAPLGAGSIELSSQADGVILRSSDGGQMQAQSAEILLQQLLGWPLPVSGLRYWLLGVPVPNTPYTLVSWLQNKQLYIMQQDGWHIEFRQYQKVNAMMLPRKIFMHRLDDVEADVRIIIRHWNINNE